MSNNVIVEYYGRNFTTILGQYLSNDSIQLAFQNDEIDSYKINSNVLGLIIRNKCIWCGCV